MKDYKKVAEDVFRRRDEVIAENKIRRKRLAEIGISAACWAAVGAVGFGIWKTNISGKNISTVDPQSSTSQGADASLTDSEPLSENTSSSNDTVNEYIIDGVDVRCIPWHSNVAILPHTRIDKFEVDMDEWIDHGDYGAGAVKFTRSLIEPMKKYGKTDENGEIQYDVIIEFYKEHRRIDPTQELFENECEFFGKNLYFETDSSCRHIGLCSATYEMLENFTPSEDYCYVFYLRGNFFGDSDTSSNERIYNHGDHTAPFELEGADFCNPRGTISNIDAEIKEPEYSPESGTVLFSESLKKAIEKYGKTDKNGELYYRVIIEYYKDGKRIDTTKELWESERDGGVRNNFESLGSDWGATWEHHIWATKTVDNLESYKPSSEYGCVLYLYNAYFGRPYSLTDNVINGLYNDGVYIEETDLSIADDEILSINNYSGIILHDPDYNYYISTTGGMH